MIEGSPSELAGGENIATLSAFPGGAPAEALLGNALLGVASSFWVAAVSVLRILPIDSCGAKAPTVPTTCTFHPEGSCAVYHSTTSSKRLEVMRAAVVW